VLKQCDISTRIQDLLRPEWPLIVLVHDEDSVRTLLGNLGIDTADFSSGIKSLLQPEDAGVFRSQYTYKDSRRRSRSPNRDERLRDQCRRSPPRTQMPVCLVDVHQMYITLRTRYTDSNISLFAVATELGLSGDERSMCAGNESRLLAEAWSSMASGPAIDEQNDARWGPGATHPKSASSVSGFLPGLGDADFDPNDLAPTGSTAVARPSQPSQMADWDDLDDDEDEFYGR